MKRNFSLTRSFEAAGRAFGANAVSLVFLGFLLWIIDPPAKLVPAGFRQFIMIFGLGILALKLVIIFNLFKLAMDSTKGPGDPESFSAPGAIWRCLLSALVMGASMALLLLVVALPLKKALLMLGIPPPIQGHLSSLAIFLAALLPAVFLGNLWFILADKGGTFDTALPISIRYGRQNFMKLYALGFLGALAGIPLGLIPYDLSSIVLTPFFLVVGAAIYRDLKAADSLGGESPPQLAPAGPPAKPRRVSKKAAVAPKKRKKAVK